MFIEHKVNDETRFYEIEEISIKSSGTTAFYRETELGDRQGISIPDSALLEGATESATLNWLVSEDGLFAGGAYMEKDAYLLRKAQTAKHAEIKSRRVELEESGLVTSFGEVDSDPDSQRKIAGAIQMAMISRDAELGATHFPDGFNLIWRFSDNTTRPLTAAEMIQMGVEVGKQVTQFQMVKNHFDGIVGAATTVAEVEAVDVQVDWLAVGLMAA